MKQALGFSTLACLSVCFLGGSSAQTEENRAPAAVNEIQFGIGGIGGAYFLAEPGPLIVDLEKRDRNRQGRQRDMRAILVGPDRRVIQQVTIPDGRARLTTQVDRKGVYGLNVTVSQDRYGDEIIWGFRTNCPRYLVETSRGHRDERHQEPIVFLRPDLPGNVAFMPRRGAFTLEAENLVGGVKALPVYDANDTLIHEVPVSSDGRASHTFAPGLHRDSVPWRLHLPAQQATVHIDGVTRWARGDPYPDLCYWTPEPGSFFPFREYRWLLTPYSRTVHGRAGEQGEIFFQVHNNDEEQRTVRLELEFPGESWRAELAVDRVVLASNETARVGIHYTVPAASQTRVCHVRVTPAEEPDFSTYSTLTVKAGVAPAASFLDLPLVLQPYEHENEQLGYLPDYPLDNEVYFDLDNRPFVRTAGGIATLSDGVMRTVLGVSATFAMTS